MNKYTHNDFKFLTFYSLSHKELYNTLMRSFGKIYSNNVEIITKEIQQYSESGEYESSGFDVAMLNKIQFIIENINLSDKRPCFFADADIIFFKEIDFSPLNNDIDIAFQDDRYSYCAGQFMFKQNKKVLEFFKIVKDLLLREISNENNKIHDQTIINRLIKYNTKKTTDLINHSSLDINKYYTIASLTNGTVWDKTLILDYAKININELISFHANWTIGIENKKQIIDIFQKLKK